MRLLILLLACFSLAAAAAEVYRWVDKDGVVHYSDKPLAAEAKPVPLPPLQTYKAGTSPPLFTPAPAAGAPAPAAAAGAIAITAPGPEETIRNGEGKLMVAVAAEVKDGQGLVYYLDGGAQNATPTPSTQYLYTGVERGQHSVGVALVGADGKELARAAPVTVYFMPPQVKH